MTRRLLTLLLLSLGTSACGGAIAEDVAEAVPEPLIQGSLRTLHEPDTRELVADLAASPVVERATEGFVARITDGTLEALSEEERAERIAAAVSGFVREVGQELADVVGREVAPALSRSVALGLERALVRVTNEDNREELAELARTLGRAGAEQLAYGVHEAFRDPEVQRTLGLTAQNIGYRITMGAGEAIEEIEERQRSSRATSSAAGASSQPASDPRAAQSPRGSTPWAVMAAVALAALLLAVFLASRLQVRRRDRALLAIANALKDAEGAPWEAELRRTLRRRFRDDPDADHLRDLLRRHPELRIGGREDPPPRRLEPAEAT